MLYAFGILTAPSAQWSKTLNQFNGKILYKKKKIGWAWGLNGVRCIPSVQRLGKSLCSFHAELLKVSLLN